MKDQYLETGRIIAIAPDGFQVADNRHERLSRLILLVPWVPGCTIIL